MPVEEERETTAEESELQRQQMAENVDRPIEDLDLSVRAKNCLDAISLQTIGDLAKMTESELLKLRNFGKTSLKEIRKKLADMGLSLGLNIESLK